MLLSLLANSAFAGHHALLLATAQSPTATPLDLDRDLHTLELAVAAAPWGQSAVVRVPETSDPIAALWGLHARAAPGDHLLVHISGHGSRIADDNRDEADGWDEGLLLADGTVVRDDDLRPVVDALRDRVGPGGHVAITLDTCHSGGLMRGLTPARRGTGPRLPGADTLGDEWIDAHPTRAPLTVLAAARADESAEEQPDGGGRFSRALAHALVRAPADATWAGVHQHIQAELARTAPRQHPVLLGATRHPLTTAHAAQGGLPVDGVVHGPPAQVRIAGGHLLGFDAQDTFTLHLPDGRECPAEVVTVAGSQAFLAPTCAADPSLLAQARVVLEKDAAPPAPLVLDLPPALQADLLPELRADGWVPGPSAMKLSLHDSQLVLQTPAGTRVEAPPHLDWSDSPVATALRQHKRALDLAQLQLRGDGDPVLHLRAADPTTCTPGPLLSPSPDGTYILPPGMGVTVEVSHTASAPRAVHLVHFAEDHTATALVDAHDAPLLPPGTPWISPRCWQTVPPTGTERLKLLIARTPVALAPWLTGSAVRTDWTLDGSTTTLTYSVAAPAARADAAR